MRSPLGLWATGGQGRSPIVGAYRVNHLSNNNLKGVAKFTGPGVEISTRNQFEKILSGRTLVWVKRRRYVTNRFHISGLCEVEFPSRIGCREVVVSARLKNMLPGERFTFSRSPALFGSGQARRQFYSSDFPTLPANIKSRRVISSALHARFSTFAYLHVLPIIGLQA